MEKYIHAFNLIPGMGYVTLKRIWEYFKNWQQAWMNESGRFLLEAGLSSTAIALILYAKKKTDINLEFEKLQSCNITAFGDKSAEYPEVLKEIPNPPFLLYRKGAQLDNTQRHIGIVGTRIPSTYGQKVASELSEKISLAGGITVSGLAFGIDAKVHNGAIKNQKPTIAILASQLTNITPPTHFRLAQDIIRYGGTLLSEYAHDHSFHKARYHQRNRLISGLSEATIIIEAKQKSGALITARHALEQNKPIYALPGDITRSQAQGCLRLIGEGATPIISIRSLLEELGFQNRTEKYKQFTQDEQKILLLIEKNSLFSEELSEVLDMAFPQLNAVLSSLELQGAIVKNEAARWEIGVE